MTRLRGLLAILLLLPGAAFAHKPSDSYLSLRVEGADLRGQWDIALRDLELAVGLDGDGDGRITWGELRAAGGAVEAYAGSRLAIASAGLGCPLRFDELLTDRHTDGAYAVLRFEARCVEAPSRLDVDYGLLFDLDPLHRGLLRLERAGRTSTAIFGVDSARQRLVLGEEPVLRTLGRYAREGVWHIWIGADHVLFLLCLLLPAVLRREEGHWRPVPRLRDALGQVLRLVTAFTAAHSITLCLAVLGWIALPSRLVESAIAASVVLAALDNLHPLFAGRRTALAFGFGLVHGMGFASVLADLGLPRGSLVPALLGFNLGVELGQLAIVAALVPLAFALRGSAGYRRVAFPAGSAAIACLAAAWLAERSLAIRLPFLPWG
jgi:hypothetical protein